jgi:hypothetical protein
MSTILLTLMSWMGCCVAYAGVLFTDDAVRLLFLLSRVLRASSRGSLALSLSVLQEKSSPNVALA